ncbi:hypothetical protein GCM10011414_26140 [Croceivirga lutea]|uniref:sensor histidine kinase n=1 Tax=Croceivirga lutea TaxID=1775167 RepID=UPI00163A0151|nr:histidine kinase [Croceivirga lutea]GGG55047.1 hypothetical protein GCM10011414_26140 [Croceivirga lutea]
MNFFVNSKPIIGFNDTILVVLGIISNTAIFIGIFYQGAFIDVPFTHFIFKTLEYLLIITAVWLTLRYLFLLIAKRYTGRENRKIRLAFLPFLFIPFFILVYGYLEYVQPIFIAIYDPYYAQPNHSYLISTGFVVTLLDIVIYTVINYANQLNNTQLETEILLREKAVSELNTLKNQLSPHFLFNSLNTLLYLIDEDKETSKDFIYKLSFLYQKLLQYSNKDFITVSEELQYLKAYTGLLEKRHGGKLIVDLKIDQAVGQLFLVPLSTQMAVENAVKHNTISKAHPLTITISNEPYYIVISNKLKGKFAIGNSLGIGLENLQKRYKLLSNREVFYEKTNDLFILKIPLLDAWELKLKER